MPVKVKRSYKLIKTRKPYETKAIKALKEQKKIKEENRIKDIKDKLNIKFNNDLIYALTNNDNNKIIVSINSLKKIGYSGNYFTIIKKSLPENIFELLEDNINEFLEWNENRIEKNVIINNNNINNSINNTYVFNFTNSANNETCNHDLIMFAKNIFCELSKCKNCGFVERIEI